MRALLLLLWGATAFAASGTVTRWNFDRSAHIALEIVDDHPDGLRIDNASPLKLRYEGTYGSDELLGNEYFRADDLVVVVGYALDSTNQRVGGITLHGRAGGRDYEGERFWWSDGTADSVVLTSTGGAAAHGLGYPFCTAASGIASLDDADCLVSFSDVYEPVEKWNVMFHAQDRASDYGSGASFSFAHFDGEPDGNGIYLAKAQEPACLRDHTCVFFVGRLMYWRGKRSYFAIEVRLRDGRPESAIAHDLQTYGGGVAH